MIVKRFTPLGVAQCNPVLGTVEIVFAALLIPKMTMKLGFILLPSYFAGAMSIELSHGMTPLAPGVLLAIIWICPFVRDRSIFFTSPQ